MGRLVLGIDILIHLKAALDIGIVFRKGQRRYLQSEISLV